MRWRQELGAGTSGCTRGHRREGSVSQQTPARKHPLGRGGLASPVIGHPRADMLAQTEWSCQRPGGPGACPTPAEANLAAASSQCLTCQQKSSPERPQSMLFKENKSPPGGEVTALGPSTPGGPRVPAQLCPGLPAHRGCTTIQGFMEARSTGPESQPWARFLARDPAKGFPVSGRLPCCTVQGAV